MSTPPIVHPGEAVCRLEELPDQATKLFILRFPDGEEIEFFALRQGGSVRGFVNECPHQGLPLNGGEDSCLNGDGGRILCGVHGATFDLVTGQALSGPALPDGCLMKVPLTIVDGEVRLAPR